MAWALVVVAACALPGCSEWRDARTVEVAGYDVSISTDPQPPRVGEAAAVAVRIIGGSAGAMTGCRVNMHQTMPGMEMKGDRVEIVMQEDGDGVYRGVSREFGMGGDWRITVRFRCGDEAHDARFDYQLAWPE